MASGKALTFSEPHLPHPAHGGADASAASCVGLLRGSSKGSAGLHCWNRLTDRSPSFFLSASNLPPFHFLFSTPKLVPPPPLLYAGVPTTAPNSSLRARLLQSHNKLSAATRYLQAAILPRGRPGSGHGRGNPHAQGAPRHRGRGHGEAWPRAGNWGSRCSGRWESATRRVWLPGCWRRKEVSEEGQ